MREITTCYAAPRLSHVPAAQDVCPIVDLALCWAQVQTAAAAFTTPTEEGKSYSALTYLSSRLSAYSRRKSPCLFEPTPVGWKPEESRFLGRALPEERERFGSPWIEVFRRRQGAR